jgi:hypothetical protein
VLPAPPWPRRRAGGHVAAVQRRDLGELHGAPPRPPRGARPDGERGRHTCDIEMRDRPSRCASRCRCFGRTTGCCRRRRSRHSSSGGA